MLAPDDERPSVPRAYKQAMAGVRDSAVRVIVMATDFSENADVALAWAEQLARQHQAALVLVHAVARFAAHRQGDTGRC
jgi:hypothetical protein